MNSLILAVLATTAVYRLELTDEKKFIVGQDGVKREVVIMEPEEYAALTGKVDQVWKSLNSTEEGRKRLHGEQKNTAITDTEKVVVYSDGYTHREKMVKRTSKVVDKVRGTDKAKMPPKKYYMNISARHRAFLEKRDAARTKPVKEVTVEHNAATGKDEVK